MATFSIGRFGVRMATDQPVFVVFNMGMLGAVVSNFTVGVGVGKYYYKLL